MNLKEATKRGKLKQFAKEHENKDRHAMGKERFEGFMGAMARGKPPRERRSSRDYSGLPAHGIDL